MRFLRRRIAVLLTALIAVLSMSSVAYAGTTTSAAAGRHQFTMDARVKLVRPWVGQTFHVTGTTSSKAAGATVYLQRQAGSTWRTMAEKPVTDRGMIYFAHEEYAAGLYTYRLFMPATRSATAAASAGVRVAVSRWVTLADLPPSEGSFRTGTIHFEGISYPDSIHFAASNGVPTDSVTFDLRGRCAAFNGEVGVGDASATGTVDQITVSVNGTPALTAVLKPHQRLAVTALDPLTIRRITVSYEVIADPHSGVSYPGFYGRGFCAL